MNKFADHVSEACCTALAPILDELVVIEKMHLIKQKKKEEFSNDSMIQISTKIINPFRVGLRVDLNKDQVGYLIGMDGCQIFDEKILTKLDDELVQILHQACSSSASLNISLEFIFYVQDRFNCAASKTT